MERYVCFRPEYVGGFQCDGILCQSRCCRDWGVTLDPAILAKYRNIQDPGIRGEILSHVKATEEDGLYIELRENGWCSFLREDYLCKLQKELGEEYLSCTCRTFPRVIYRIGDLLEQSLSLACPVAAERILRSRESMAFEQVELTVGEPIVVRRPPSSAALAILPEMQYACISLLQDRRFPIDGRLALVGSFLEQAQYFLEEGQLEKLEQLAAFYGAEDIYEQGKLLFRAIRFHSRRWAKSLAFFMEVLLEAERSCGTEDLPLQRVREMFGEAHGVLEDKLEGFGNGEYFSLREGLMKRHAHILENYLVNEFFLNIYPLRIQGTLLENFHGFLLSYKLLELILAAEARMQGGELDEEILAGLLEDFAYRMDHGAVHIGCVKEMVLKEKVGLAPLLNTFLQDAVGAL